MKLILLPGMDGTGLLFKPLLEKLSDDISSQTITYPTDSKLNYSQLTSLVVEKLPKNEPFILLAESFSGSIGYAIASNPPKNLKAVIFVATFLTLPNKLLRISTILPLSLLLKLPLPNFIIKHFLLGKDIKEPTVALFKESLKMVGSNLLTFRVREMSKLKCGEKPVQIPCAYITPKNDKLVSHRHIDEFKQLASQIEIIKIQGPHFILQAKPKESAKVIEKYSMKLSSQ